jgi:hypothetical protein
MLPFSPSRTPKPPPIAVIDENTEFEPLVPEELLTPEPPAPTVTP